MSFSFEVSLYPSFPKARPYDGECRRVRNSKERKFWTLHFWARFCFTTFTAPGERDSVWERERERRGRVQSWASNFDLSTQRPCRPWPVNTPSVGTSVISVIRCEVCCCSLKHLLFNIECLVINRYLLEVFFCFLVFLSKKISSDFHWNVKKQKIQIIF